MEPRKDPVTDPYVRLRTMLDSLEDGCLRYYLSHQGTPEGGERFEKIRNSLMPIIEWVWAKKDEIICPPGYNECDGVCVPYTCPRGTEPLPQK